MNNNQQLNFFRTLPVLMAACLALQGLAGAAIAADTEENASPLSDQLAAWRSSAEDGEAWAAFNLALSYHAGRDVPVNKREAVRWYRVAAEKGYAAAQANLGYCYETAFGVAIDYGEAVRWYQRAAIQGHPYAQYSLGKKYQTGPGVATDPKLAEKWLKRAAEQRFVPAYFSLGQLYVNGVAGQRNYTDAFEWFHLAADQGYPAAQHAIGYLYFSGLSGQTNYFEAVKWFRLAASRNFADSHFNLAYCYERGLGVPQNLSSAVAHYKTAAGFGHPSAQYSLGVAYYEGKGMQTDLVQAYKWWNLASVAGIPQAASSKEILSELMTDDEITEAQHLASEFIPSKSEDPDAPTLVVASAIDMSQVKRVGSGFFVSTNGYLLTTHRTVSDAKIIQVITEGGEFEATIEKSSPIIDIALLKITGNPGTLPLTPSTNVQLDLEILTLGFDEENQGEFSPKTARSKITELLGYQADPRQLTIGPQLTDPFGGTAVINPSGQIIGMVLLDHEEPTTQPTTQSTDPAMAYAIKSDYLISFLNSVQEVTPIIEQESGPELSTAELMSRARAATALILVIEPDQP